MLNQPCLESANDPRRHLLPLCLATLASLVSLGTPPVAAADPVGDSVCDQQPCPSQCAAVGPIWMKDRIQPPGNLSPRYPYETFRMYYYRRPYNPAHLEQHVAENDAAHSPQKLPYATSWMTDIYQTIEHEALKQCLPRHQISPDATRQLLSKDKPLEFVDWRKHHRSRLHWESAQDDLSETLRSLINENALHPTGMSEKGVRSQ